MNIRPAVNADIAGILELLRQVGSVHHDIRPDLFRPDARKYDEAALNALLTDPETPIFVAMRGSFVAGYCFCRLRSCESSVFTPRTELYIDDLCVDEGCRGQGIATALYAHALSFARTKNCAFVTLNVWCGNDSALRFYEKCGLKPRNIMMELPLEDV